MTPSKTPFGQRVRMLGGSAVHFSLAASFFTDVRVVGPVGDDFGDADFKRPHGRDVITDDIEHVEGGETFFWKGDYEFDLNTRGDRGHAARRVRRLPPAALQRIEAALSPLFLANIQPDLQLQVREQAPDARRAGLDSMNLWIDTARDSLEQPIAGVDLVFMNDAEIRMFAAQPNLLRAARKIIELGPRAVIAKQGEYGASLFDEDRFFALPAFPLESVNDPTGRGRLLRRRLPRLPRLTGRGAPDQPALRRAMTYGSVLASFNVEDFGTERVELLTRDEIDHRHLGAQGAGRMTSLSEISHGRLAPSRPRAAQPARTERSNGGAVGHAHASPRLSAPAQP